MKFLILAALVVAGSCFPGLNGLFPVGELNSNPSETKFMSGSEYEYEYESQVMTGLPTFSKQYAGIKIICNVKIAFNSPTSCAMQMKDVKLMSINAEVSDHKYLPPFRQLPDELFSQLPVSSAEVKMVLKKLELPLQFNYDNGKVDSISVTDEETNWSINFKRAILSMLQVRMEEEKPSQYNSVVKDNLEKYNATSFNVQEPGLEGDCLSTHHVYSDPPTTPENIYKVIKSRDITNCLKINNVDKNVHPQKQMNCDCRDNMIHQNCKCKSPQNIWDSSVARYNKLGTVYDLKSEDAKTFVIRRAVQSVEYRTESPQSPNQYILTASNQTLILVDHRESLSIPTFRFSWKKLNQPWSMKPLAEEEEKYMMTSDEILQKTRQILTALGTFSDQPEVRHTHYSLFFQLVESIRLCKLNQLTAIFEETKHESKQNHKQWQMYLDALRTVNTTDADKLILTKIVSGEIPQIEAMSVLVIWTAEKVPSHTILEFMSTSVITPLRSNKKMRNVYHQSLLCFGSMIRRYIQAEEVLITQCALPVDRQFHSENILNCRKYEKIIEGTLHAASTAKEKIVLLKAIANLGSINTLPTLKMTLTKEGESTAVRVHAVWAFNKLGVQNKLKTLETLQPIMLRPREDSELRIAAFVTIMKCKPSTTLWELQRHLNNVQDLEFKTFVVKYLQNMLELHEPKSEQLQMRVRQVLKSVRAFPMSKETNEYQQQFGLQNTQGNSEIIKISKIANYTSTIPRSASFKYFSQNNNELNHLFELGYRAEGLETLYSKYKFPESQHPKPKQANHPSFTFYARVLGQQVVVAHFDERAVLSLGKLIKRNSGVVEVPVSFFRTVLINPMQTRQLQPSGVWFHSKLDHYLIMDVEGVFRVEMNNQQLPIITFQTNKPIRFEVSSHCVQQVNYGFAVTGLTNVVSGRFVAETEQTTIRLNLRERLALTNFTAPTANEFLFVEADAGTFTFVIPLRLPKVTVNRNGKILKVDETNRRTFNEILPLFKSVELNAQLEGDVNMPAMYDFVRDRMRLIPTNMYLAKQHLKLNFQSAASYNRTYCLMGTYRYFVPTPNDIANAQSLMYNPNTYEQSEETSESVEEEPHGLWNFLGMGKSSSSSSSETPEEPESNVMADKKFLYPKSLGSLCHLRSLSLSSVSDHQSLNMSANWTTCFEHDQPTTRALINFLRPPIPSQEKERFQFVDQITSSVNLGTNVVLQSHRMRWGPVSNTEKKTITVTTKLRPTYKDNVCHEQRVYGCKDDFGVIYPIWYNSTVGVESTNTKIPGKIRKYMEPFLTNYAESIYMSENKRLIPLKSFNFNIVVRPIEAKVDLILQNQHFVTNISRVFAPVLTKLHNYIAERQYPIGDVSVTSEEGYLPIPHRVNSLSSQKGMCVYISPKVYTFDKKSLPIPHTSCEVVLAGDCQKTHKNMQVSIIPSDKISAPKMLKISLGEKKIDMNLEKKLMTSEFEILVNKKVQKLKKDGSLQLKDDQEVIATILCIAGRCQILSKLYGLYIDVSEHKVTVEVDAKNSHHLCGLCSMRPELPKRISVPSAVAITKDNLIAGEQCTVRKPTTVTGISQDQCIKLNKFRVVEIMDDVNGRLMQCVTDHHKPICSDTCTSRTRHMVEVEAHCVYQDKAEQIGLLSARKIEAGEYIIEDQKVIRQVRRENKRRPVQIQKYDQCKQ